MNEDKELNLEDLENILSGAPRKIAEDVALENSNLHRQQQIEKLKQTPKKYPRAGGKPLKQPLLAVKKER